MEKKIKIEVTMEGCHELTRTVLDVTEEEYGIIEWLKEELNKEAETLCHPEMTVEELES